MTLTVCVAFEVPRRCLLADTATPNNVKRDEEASCTSAVLLTTIFVNDSYPTAATA